LLECSALDFGQEIREFLVCGQLVAFFMFQRLGDVAGRFCMSESPFNPRHLSKTPL
jgi:hypothetical protein